jgi:hypothetical protein
MVDYFIVDGEDSKLFNSCKNKHSESYVLSTKPIFKSIFDMTANF